MEVLALSLCVERVLRLDYQQVGHIVNAEIISLGNYLVQCALVTLSLIIIMSYDLN